MNNLDKVRAHNQVWEQFKKQYQLMDTDISKLLKYVPENEIAPTFAELSHGEIDALIKGHIDSINQLRSTKYHKLRHEAFEKRQRLQKRIAEQAEIESENKETQQRNFIGKRLRGIDKAIFKATKRATGKGMLPTEVKKMALEILANLPTQNGESN